MYGSLKMAFLAAVLAVAVGACARDGRVIPAGKMEKIYREMFLADQWLTENPGKRSIADTTWFYEPIFDRYGYTVEDYRRSVDYYLNDPERFSEMLGRVAEGLKLESDALNRKLRYEEMARHRADSIANARKSFSSKDFQIYGDLFYSLIRLDSIDIRLNDKGVYYTVPVDGDTIFRGPEIVLKEKEFADIRKTIPRNRF